MLKIGAKRKMKAATPPRDSITHAASQRKEYIFFTLSLDVSCILSSARKEGSYFLRNF